MAKKFKELERWVGRVVFKDIPFDKAGEYRFMLNKWMLVKPSMVWLTMLRTIFQSQ